MPCAMTNKFSKNEFMLCGKHYDKIMQLLGKVGKSMKLLGRVG